MKVKIFTNFGEQSFEIRDEYKNEVIDFLSTLEANGKLLLEIKNLKTMIHDLVNKKHA